LTSLLYIHGFNSSPQSLKARQMAQHFAAHNSSARLIVPALPPAPQEAMALLEREIAGAGPVALVGSSLGGFYATWLAHRHGLKAALINPAVRPWGLLDQYSGEQANYHTGERYTLQPGWVDDLRHYEVAEISAPQNLLVMLQTGDETLNWRDAWDYYGDCHLYRALGGSHGFDDFDVLIPLVLRFSGISLT
jgi:predicted esterase YcpF (UPF0227 family)